MVGTFITQSMGKKARPTPATKVMERYEQMLSERDRFLDEWETCDHQFEANVYEDNF